MEVKTTAYVSDIFEKEKIPAREDGKLKHKLKMNIQNSINNAEKMLYTYFLMN